MMTFTVHEPPSVPADRLERAEALAFVREGFTWSAAFLTPFWMIANRLWLPLIAYLAAVGLLEAGLWAAGVSHEIAGWLLLGLHVLIGFEADGIRRWSLGRQGYTMIGSVNGRSADECERRFFEAWLKEQPFLPPSVPASGTSGRTGRLGHLSLGLRRG